MKLLERLKQEAQQRQADFMERRLYTFAGVPQAHMYFQDQGYINFVSNNYLGLAGHPEIIKRSQDWTARWGSGSTGSRLLGGDMECHQLMENQWAKLKKSEAALIFNSGMSANQAIGTALFTPRTEVFSDRLNHASIVDGIRLSSAKMQRYHHNDMEHLERLLQKKPDSEKAIITDAVFSMDGDVAPLEEICELAEKYEALVIVDEAHSDGILGPEGAGLVAALGLEERVHVVMSTFGKAYGCFGAAISCSQLLKEAFINKARSFIFTTALPPAVLGSISAAIEVAQQESWRRNKLLEMSSKLREELEVMGYDLLNSSTQIIPIVMGSNDRAVQAAEKLKSQGIWTQAIREPTVPRGSARLRVNICADHSEEDLDKLLAALKGL